MRLVLCRAGGCTATPAVHWHFAGVAGMEYQSGDFVVGGSMWFCLVQCSSYAPATVQRRPSYRIHFVRDLSLVIEEVLWFLGSDTHVEFHETLLVQAEPEDERNCVSV